VKLEQVRPVKLEQAQAAIKLPRSLVDPPAVEENPPFDEDDEMASTAEAAAEPFATGIAAPAAVAPAAAMGDFPEAAAGGMGGATAGAVSAPEFLHYFAAAGTATIGMNSAPPADEATPPLVDSLPRQPENQAVDPAASSSSSSGYCGGAGVPEVPVSAAPEGVADPVVAALEGFTQAARMGIGCRSNKTGIANVALSKSGRGCCKHCKAKIANKVPRFLYWHSHTAPPGWIHTGCIVGLPFSAAELRDNLSDLSPTEPILRDAVVDAMAALTARAF
jgi:hypothetical protein